MKKTPEKIEEVINQAAMLRSEKNHAEALLLLNELLIENPDNAVANYQAAWTYDSMGAETEAVPYYEKAITFGLTGHDLQGAYLGLGSTYRCIGLYQKSLALFDKAIADFPENRVFKVFRALTQYNLKDYAGCAEELIRQLVATSSDSNIKNYSRALEFYSDKLDQTWT